MYAWGNSSEVYGEGPSNIGLREGAQFYVTPLQVMNDV